MASTIEDALTEAKNKSGNQNLTEKDLKQDEDVLDTWFSSWLWPISVFDGFRKDADQTDLNYYYPTNDLVTAPEIMFFWVARMIISGYEYKKELPFRNVYYTGIVRDKLGRKMSKQLGNSPDPIELMQKYGADGVRIGMLLCSPAGNDLMFDSAYCEQGRNFSNKVWNAFRLVQGWNVMELEQPLSNKLAAEWLRAKLAGAIKEINDHFDKFRISDALMSMYKLIWDDFCSWYLEMIKPGYEAPIDKKTYEETISLFEELLKLMHPFMPFISEEIWQEIGKRDVNNYLIVSKWPQIKNENSELLVRFEKAKDIIVGVRGIRNEKNIAQKVKLKLAVKTTAETDKSFNEIIIKFCNLSEMEYVKDSISNAYSFVVKSAEYFIPFNEQIDLKAEKASLQQELVYTKGFLAAVEKKLSNERFVSGAPEKVLALEKQKQADALAKIKLLEEKLTALN